MNGDNVEEMSHKEVVEKIKAVPDIVRMLVVDAEADKYFIAKQTKLSSSMDERFLERITCPSIKPGRLPNS